MIAKIYREEALSEIRNPVVVLHGILGARLAQRSTGKAVWGAFTDDYADPKTAGGARAIALPYVIPGPCLEFDPEKEDIYATGPLETLKLNFLFKIISVDIYKNIMRTLGVGGYRDRVLMSQDQLKYSDDHFTCYSFFYDWRRDNVHNAIMLGRFLTKARGEIHEKAAAKIATLRKLRTDAARHEADQLDAWLERGFRFDIVAHSMGGLIARYFLRYGAADLPADGTSPTVTWRGADEIDRLVLVGTPSLGSMKSLKLLTNGYDPGIGVPFYDQAILGSMPSVYQLLPRARHGVVRGAIHESSPHELTDPRLWIANRWGPLDAAAEKTLAWLIPNKAEEARLEQARNYLTWCLDRARAFQHSLDKKPGADCPAEVYLFAADSEPTLARTLLRKRPDGRVVPEFPMTPETIAFGDTSVPRYSALGDERQGSPFQPGMRTNIPLVSETLLSDDHLGLTRNPLFTNNLLHLLLEKRPRRTTRPGSVRGRGRDAGPVVPSRPTRR